MANPLIALIPPKYKAVLDMVVAAVPLLNCAVNGHEEGVRLSGTGVPVATCKRCGTVYEVK